MEVTEEIKDMESWEEASKWLERHGWGLGLIEEQKAAWDAAKAPKPVEAKASPKSAVILATTAPEPVKTKTTSFGKKGK